MARQQFIARRPAREMTFENFVPWPENMHAMQLAILMAENGRCAPGTTMLSVYGDPGTGKTHLLSAIANGARALSTMLVSTAELRDHCDKAWAQGLASNMKDFLIEPDILLLDDLGGCEGYEQFQGELSEVVKLRLMAGLSVVVGASSPPSVLKLYDESDAQLLASGETVRMRWCPPAERARVLRASVPTEILTDQIVEGLAEAYMQDGHELKILVEGLTAKPEVRRLLEDLGYRPYKIWKVEVEGRSFLASRWQLTLDRRAHVVELVYSFTSKRVMTRCWCNI